VQLEHGGVAARLLERACSSGTRGDRARAHAIAQRELVEAALDGRRIVVERAQPQLLARGGLGHRPRDAQHAATAELDVEPR